MAIDNSPNNFGAPDYKEAVNTGQVTARSGCAAWYETPAGRDRLGVATEANERASEPRERSGAWGPRE